MVEFLVDMEVAGSGEFQSCYPLARGRTFKVTDGDQVIEKRKSFWLFLDYPLYEPEAVLMIKESGDWTKQNFADAVSEAYQRHWRERRSNFRTHAACELYLEGAERNAVGSWTVSIGS